MLIVCICYYYTIYYRYSIYLVYYTCLTMISISRTFLHHDMHCQTKLNLFNLIAIFRFPKYFPNWSYRLMESLRERVSIGVYTQSHSLTSLISMLWFVLFFARKYKFKIFNLEVRLTGNKISSSIKSVFLPGRMLKKVLFSWRKFYLA